MDEVIDYMTTYNKLIRQSSERSQDLALILGSHRIFNSGNSANFRVSLTGSMYQLSFAYIYGGSRGTVETALVGPEGSLVYIEELDYGNVLVHTDTLHDCLEEINRVEELLNLFANRIRNAWLNYKRRRDAAVVIQRAYREARDNPTYMLCEQIQMRNLEDIGCQLSN